MRHFHVKTANGKDAGSWSAGPNGANQKVLAQLTDVAGSQSRAVLDIESATLLVHHLIIGCQAVIDPEQHPSRQPGLRWHVERQGKGVSVTIYDDIMQANETTTVIMPIDDATDFAQKLMEAIISVQRSQNEDFYVKHRS